MKFLLVLLLTVLSSFGASTTTSFFKTVEANAVNFNLVEIGTVANAGTATIPLTTNVSTAVYSGATATINLPEITIATNVYHVVHLGTNTSGGIQIISLNVDGTPTPMRRMDIKATVSQFTNGIAADFIAEFINEGLIWKLVQVVGDAIEMGSSGGGGGSSGGLDPIRDDLFDAGTMSSTTTTGPLGLIRASSGAGAGLSSAIGLTNFSQARMICGTTTTGYSAIFTDQLEFAFGTLGVTNRFKFKIPTLPVATNTAIIRMGFGDSVTAAAGVDAVRFFYSYTNAQLLCIARAGSVDTVKTNTTTIVANQWYTANIVVSPDASTATFTIDDTDAVVISTGVPSSTTQATGLQYSIIKDGVGAASLDLTLDWITVDFPR